MSRPILNQGIKDLIDIVIVMADSNKLRVQIESFFHDNPGKFFSVSEIANQFNALRNTIHYHLKKLKQKGFLGQNDDGEYFLQQEGSPFVRSRLRPGIRNIIAGGVFLSMAWAYLLSSIQLLSNPLNYSGTKLIIEQSLEITLFIIGIVSLPIGLILLIAGIIKFRRSASTNANRPGSNKTENGAFDANENAPIADMGGVNDEQNSRLGALFEHVSTPLLVTGFTWLTWPWIGKVYRTVSHGMQSIEIKGVEKELSGAGKFFKFSAMVCIINFVLIIASIILEAILPMYQFHNYLLANMILLLIWAKDVFLVTLFINLKRAWKRVKSIFQIDERHAATMILSTNRILSGTMLSFGGSLLLCFFDVPTYMEITVLSEIVAGINPHNFSFLTIFLGATPIFIIAAVAWIIYIIGIIIQANATKKIAQIASGKSITVKIGSVNLAMSSRDAAHVAKEITEKLADSDKE